MIFLRDKSDSIKGPFTERQMQDWYREGWFESNFRFYFTDSIDSITDSTKGFTLGEMRSINGIGCPFLELTEEDSNGIKRGKRLMKNDEDISIVRDKCEQILKVVDRLEKVEKMIEKMPTDCPSSEKEQNEKEGVKKRGKKNKKKKEKKSAIDEVENEINQHDASAPVETTEKKEENGDEPKKPLRLSFALWRTYRKTAIEVAEYLMNAFDQLEFGKFKWDIQGSRKFVGSFMASVPKGKEAKTRHDLCFYELIKRMKTRDAFRCCLCNSISLNYKQFLCHLWEAEHEQNEIAANKEFFLDARCLIDIFTEMPNEWGRLANEEVNKCIARNGKVFVLELTRPTPGFFMEIKMKCLAVMNPPEHFYRKTKGEFGRGLMREIDEHIGDNMTACTFCGLLTGTREDYYRHLISPVHVKGI